MPPDLGALALKRLPLTGSKPCVQGVAAGTLNIRQNFALLTKSIQPQPCKRL